MRVSNLNFLIEGCVIRSTGEDGFYGVAWADNDNEQRPATVGTAPHKTIEDCKTELRSVVNRHFRLNVKAGEPIQDKNGETL